MESRLDLRAAYEAVDALEQVSGGANRVEPIHMFGLIPVGEREIDDGGNAVRTSYNVLGYRSDTYNGQTTEYGNTRSGTESSFSVPGLGDVYQNQNITTVRPDGTTTNTQLDFTGYSPFTRGTNLAGIESGHGFGSYSFNSTTTGPSVNSVSSAGGGSGLLTSEVNRTLNYDGPGGAVQSDTALRTFGTPALIGGEVSSGSFVNPDGGTVNTLSGQFGINGTSLFGNYRSTNDQTTAALGLQSGVPGFGQQGEGYVAGTYSTNDGLGYRVENPGALALGTALSFAPIPAAGRLEGATERAVVGPQFGSVAQSADYAQHLFTTEMRGFEEATTRVPGQPTPRIESITPVGGHVWGVEGGPDHFVPYSQDYLRANGITVPEGAQLGTSYYSMDIPELRNRQGSVFQEPGMLVVSKEGHTMFPENMSYQQIDRAVDGAYDQFRQANPDAANGPWRGTAPEFPNLPIEGYYRPEGRDSTAFPYSDGFSTPNNQFNYWFQPGASTRDGLGEASGVARGGDLSGIPPQWQSTLAPVGLLNGEQAAPQWPEVSQGQGPQQVQDPQPLREADMQGGTWDGMEEIPLPQTTVPNETVEPVIQDDPPVQSYEE